MLVEHVKTAEAVLRTAAGNAGSLAGADPRDLAGRRRTQNPVLHVEQATIGIPGCCELIYFRCDVPTDLRWRMTTDQAVLLQGPINGGMLLEALQSI